MMAGESSEISVADPVQANPVPQADFIFRCISNADFLIEDGRNKTIFTANPYPSKYKQIALHDSNSKDNDVIYLMSKKMFSPYCQWKAYRGINTDDSDLVYIMRKEHMYQSATNLVVLMPNEESGKQECAFKINRSKGTFRVYKEAKLIAEMKSTDVKDMFMVTINPDVDSAVVLSLFAIIQAMKNSPDKHHHHSRIGVVAHVIKAVAAVAGVICAVCE